MNGKLIQSAKFKKDYMMLLAFLLFFLIVATELFLIIWLPWHVRIDGMWARQVAQQEIIERFDIVRARSRSLSAKLPKPAGAEAALICRSLDRAAAHMHKYGKSMSPAQCRAFMDIILRENSMLGAVGNNRAFSQSVELDCRKYINTLRGVKTPLIKSRKKK